MNKKVDAGFAHVDADIRELRAEVRSLHRVIYGICVTAVIVVVLGSNAFS